MKPIITLIILLILLSSCGTPTAKTYRPIIDWDGMRRAHYKQDLQECQIYAKNAFSDQHSKDAIQTALHANAVGEFLTVLPGPNTNPDHEGNRIMEKQKTIIKNCMKGRGYKILE